MRFMTFDSPSCAQEPQSDQVVTEPDFRCNLQRPIGMCQRTQTVKVKGQTLISLASRADTVFDRGTQTLKAVRSSGAPIDLALTGHAVSNGDAQSLQRDKVEGSIQSLNTCRSPV